MPKTRSKTSSNRVQRAPDTSEGETEEIYSAQDISKLPRMDELVIHTDNGRVKEKIEVGDW